MPGTRRPMGRQPVTVAGPRQICTAFPILPLSCSSGHLRRYLMELIKRAALESVKSALFQDYRAPAINCFRLFHVHS